LSILFTIFLRLFQFGFNQICILELKKTFSYHLDETFQHSFKNTFEKLLIILYMINYRTRWKRAFDIYRINLLSWSSRSSSLSSANLFFPTFISSWYKIILLFIQKVLISYRLIQTLLKSGYFIKTFSMNLFRPFC